MNKYDYVNNVYCAVLCKTLSLNEKPIIPKHSSEIVKNICYMFYKKYVFI